MMVSAMFHAPCMRVNNSRFRLQLYRELEARYPLFVRKFERRVDPWIVRLRNKLKSLCKKICDFFLFY